MLILTPEEKISLLDDLRKMRSSILDLSQMGKGNMLFQMLPENKSSAENLLHYLAFRSKDYRILQRRLSEVGLSSLRAAESHVLDGLNKVIHWLDPKDNPRQISLSASDAAALLLKHKCELFNAGENCSERYIMVTIDSKSGNVIDSYALLLEAGMNCARINTGHDSLKEWTQAIASIREASRRTGLNCAIYLDLSGPKIRITGIQNKHGDRKQKTKVKKGMRVLITEPAYQGMQPEITSFEIGYQNILNNLQIGQEILFDDGIASAEVIANEGHSVLVEILRIKGDNPRKIKIHNGIAFPRVKLQLSALTSEDITSLHNLARDVDIIGLSFVQSELDVRNLIELIKSSGLEHLGVVAKIETINAFESLPEILFELMSTAKSGLMIARGDLALEVGMARLAEVQEEILWMCEAASMPVIWATQVLDNLTREGVPTRAEITDAAMSVQAECVMLNKGIYVKESVHVLRQILDRMKDHHNKKASEMRRLEVAGNFYSRLTDMQTKT